MREQLKRFIDQMEPNSIAIIPAAHEATTVNVEVAWSDKPFYRDPRAKGQSMRQQMEAWQRGVTKVKGERREKEMAE